MCVTCVVKSYLKGRVGSWRDGVCVWGGSHFSLYLLAAVGSADPSSNYFLFVDDMKFQYNEVCVCFYPIISGRIERRMKTLNF